MKKINQSLTSVKVDTEVFEKFKIACIKSKFSLQKLVDRALFLYLSDEEFQSKLHNTTNLEFKEKE